jgi:hypothetical protein
VEEQNVASAELHREAATTVLAIDTNDTTQTSPIRSVHPDRIDDTQKGHWIALVFDEMCIGDQPRQHSVATMIFAR